MSQALGENDWYDWDDDARRGSRNQFRWSLQALACDADDQLTLFPDRCCKPYELASDYDNWARAARSLFDGLFTDEQRAALQAIDNLLEAMSLRGAKSDEALWYDDALSVRAEWEEVRSLAKSALACFDWPAKTPPWGRSMYSGGDSAPT